MSAPTVHTQASRDLLAWLDARIADLDVDEAHTAARGALSAYRAARRELADRLPYVEAGALVLVTPGMSHPGAMDVLGLYDEAIGGGATEAA